MEFHNRKYPRLSGYDYSSDGYYFITICTKNRENLFCTISEDTECTVNYTDYGRIAENHLLKIESHYDNVKIDKYVIMPNHIHIILVLGCNNNEERSRPLPTIPTVVGLYKSGVSREIGFSVWQKSYHDNIIRNEKSYRKIWEYIDNNPFLWKKDCYYDW